MGLKNLSKKDLQKELRSRIRHNKGLYPEIEFCTQEELLAELQSRKGISFGMDDQRGDDLKEIGTYFSKDNSGGRQVAALYFLPLFLGISIFKSMFQRRVRIRLNKSAIIGEAKRGYRIFKIDDEYSCHIHKHNIDEHNDGTVELILPAELEIKLFDTRGDLQRVFAKHFAQRFFSQS